MKTKSLISKIFSYAGECCLGSFPRFFSFTPEEGEFYGAEFQNYHNLRGWATLTKDGFSFTPRPWNKPSQATVISRSKRAHLSHSEIRSEYILTVRVPDSCSAPKAASIILENALKMERELYNYIKAIEAEETAEAA